MKSLKGPIREIVYSVKEIAYKLAGSNEGRINLFNKLMPLRDAGIAGNFDAFGELKREIEE